MFNAVAQHAESGSLIVHVVGPFRVAASAPPNLTIPHIVLAASRAFHCKLLGFSWGALKDLQEQILLAFAARLVLRLGVYCPASQRSAY
jgi:hypothetical protein